MINNLIGESSILSFKFANTYLPELIKDLNSIKTNLNASQKIGTQSIQSINTLVTELKNTITDTYADYEDDIMQIADNEKSEFRNWIDTRMKKVTEYNELLTSIIHEKDLCKAERLLLESERTEQQEWFNKIKKELTHAHMHGITPNISPDDDTLSSIHHKKTRYTCTL